MQEQESLVLALVQPWLQPLLPQQVLAQALAQALVRVPEVLGPWPQPWLVVQPSWQRRHLRLPFSWPPVQPLSWPELQPLLPSLPRRLQPMIDNAFI